MDVGAGRQPEARGAPWGEAAGVAVPCRSVHTGVVAPRGEAGSQASPEGRRAVGPRPSSIPVPVPALWPPGPPSALLVRRSPRFRDRLYDDLSFYLLNFLSHSVCFGWFSCPWAGDRFWFFLLLSSLCRFPRPRGKSRLSRRRSAPRVRSAPGFGLWGARPSGPMGGGLFPSSLRAESRVTPFKTAFALAPIPLNPSP